MHDNLMPGFSARPGGSDACNPAAKRDSAPGAPTVRQQQPPWRPAACACSCSLRVLVCYTQLFAPLDSAFCCRDSVFVHLGGRCSASGALAELRNRVSASSSATGSIGIAGAPAPWDATRRQNDGASESRRLFISAASASADATSQPNANIVSAAGIGARSPPYQQLSGPERPDNGKPNTAKGFLDLSDVENVISRLENQLGRPSSSPQLRHK